MLGAALQALFCHSKAGWGATFIAHPLTVCQKSRLNPYAEHTYDGVPLNPLEVMFVKVKHFQLEGDWMSTHLATTYDRWLQVQVLTLLRFCKIASPPRWLAQVARNLPNSSAAKHPVLPPRQPAALFRQHARRAWRAPSTATTMHSIEQRTSCPRCW